MGRRRGNSEREFSISDFDIKEEARGESDDEAVFGDFVHGGDYERHRRRGIGDFSRSSSSKDGGSPQEIDRDGCIKSGQSVFEFEICEEIRRRDVGRGE